MAQNGGIDRVFDDDETLRKVELGWTKDVLLAQEGIFYLKDVVKVLRVQPKVIKEHANAFLKDGKDPWQEIGVKKMWTHWVVRMAVFGPACQKVGLAWLLVQKVPPGIDGNGIFTLRGEFFLKDLVEKIPFHLHSIRYQFRRDPALRQRVGARQIGGSSHWVVSMPAFGNWIKEVWGRVQGATQSKSRSGG